MFHFLKGQHVSNFTNQNKNRKIKKETKDICMLFRFSFPHQTYIIYIYSLLCSYVQCQRWFLYCLPIFIFTDIAQCLLQLSNVRQGQTPLDSVQRVFPCVYFSVWQCCLVSTIFLVIRGKKRHATPIAPWTKRRHKSHMGLYLKSLWIIMPARPSCLLIALRPDQTYKDTHWHPYMACHVARHVNESSIQKMKSSFVYFFNRDCFRISVVLGSSNNVLSSLYKERIYTCCDCLPISCYTSK